MRIISAVLDISNLKRREVIWLDTVDSAATLSQVKCLLAAVVVLCIYKLCNWSCYLCYFVVKNGEAGVELTLRACSTCSINNSFSAEGVENNHCHKTQGNHLHCLFPSFNIDQLQASVSIAIATQMSHPSFYKKWVSTSYTLYYCMRSKSDGFEQGTKLSIGQFKVQFSSVVMHMHIIMIMIIRYLLWKSQPTFSRGIRMQKLIFIRRKLSWYENYVLCLWQCHLNYDIRYW